MKLTQILTGRNKNKKRNRTRRTLRFESLQNRELMAGDVCIGPQPAPEPGNTPVVEYDFGDTSFLDDLKRATFGMSDGPIRFFSDPIESGSTVVVNGGQAAARAGQGATEVVNGGQAAARNAAAATEVVNGGQAARTGDAATEVVNGAARGGQAATEVVNGGQDAARTGNAATEVVQGGQAAARTGDAATEVVSGGQAAARTGSAATEIVNGGQDALRATAGRWDHLPTFIKVPEYGAAHNAHMAAVRAGDTAEAIRTYQQMRAYEVLEYPDGRRVCYQSGQPYVPTNQIDDAIELGADSCSAGRKVVGQVIGAAATAADFVVDPVIGTIFYDENIKTGEKVFGKKSYASEAYANLQCVPALGGPLADVTACIYTVCTTDWGTYLFGAKEVPTPSQAKAAIRRYRQLEDRKDYDANHGKKHQEYLWKKVQESKAELRAMGINPANVR